MSAVNEDRPLTYAERVLRHHVTGAIERGEAQPIVETPVSQPGTCSKCERRSCRPPGYTPLCSRHYLESVKQAQAAAHARFQQHIADLCAKKGVTL